ncbi:tripartite tricarboxylate transporter TctB family protein [Celeribacter marinus]|uniref:tripartite tricarboxylate transporter TctB family protein n=1 Tax=Celeribacter marinus TaxID=1397108 RepID=UPI00317C6713
MGDLTKVVIDFEQSHLLFPRLVATVLGLLLLTILLRDRKRILNAGQTWRITLNRMDKPRFFGAIALTLMYFSSMVPVGNVWPNTGMGFLLCSVPFVFCVGALFMHDRPKRALGVLALIAIVGPTCVWWLFTYPFYLTLP